MHRFREFFTTAIVRADWLTALRARVCCNVLGLGGLCLFFLMITQPWWNDHPDAAPVFGDFISFWVAASQVLHGHVADVYDRTRHYLAELAVFDHRTFGNFAFFYPPTFLLTCLPLALVPYWLAAPVWLGVAATALVRAVRKILPQRHMLLPILSFPGITIGITDGQNGLLTGALLGWTAVLMRQNEFVAGCLLGCLVIKPHLLVAAPIVLICSGRWRAITGGILSGSLLIAGSWLILGTAAWEGFFHISATARKTLEQGAVPFFKMQSLYSSARLPGASLTSASVIQAAGTVTVLFLVGWLCLRLSRRPAMGESQTGCAPEMMLMIAALPFCTPFLLDYDLACLAFPIAWIVRQGLRSDWLPYEKIALFFAYSWLLGARLVAAATHICFTPPVAALLLLIVCRRAAPEAFSILCRRLKLPRIMTPDQTPS